MIASRAIIKGMNQTAAKIHVLPPEVANRIAAGEVVERPASVVRELLDNAIDAGARRVDIDVENGGVSLIKITDDGCGMSSQDAQLCTRRHATSKIATFEDLESIGTKGFRGEALAAISSVSKFSLKTRQADDEFATLIETQNGTLSPPQQAGGPCGTSITIRDLFHNTPARKKFMKKPSTEQGHILNTVTGLALAHEHIHFTLKHNGKRVLDCPSVLNRPERIRQLFGNDIIENLIPVSLETPAISISGLISRPTLSRNNAQQMHFFVNNRLVKDRLMHSATMNAYRNLIHAGRYPVVFLYYEIDPKEIDINVHPTKQEIKFTNENALYSATYGAIRHAWDIKEEPKKEPQPQFDGMNHEDSAKKTEPVPVSSTNSTPPKEIHVSKTEPTPPVKEPLPSAPAAAQTTAKLEQAPKPEPQPLKEETPAAKETSESIQQLNRTPIQPANKENHKTNETKPAFKQNGRGDLQSLDLDSKLFVTKSLEECGQLRVIGQMMDSYILAESKDGLLIIDQHAAHERIMFEKFFTRAENAPLESQSMLIPITIDFSPKEAEIVTDQQDLFTRLGFELEPFGPKTFVFRAIPSSLDMSMVEEAVHDILGEIQKDGSAKDTRDRALQTMACRASVKFGDKLSLEEMQAIIRDLEHMPRRNVCPHGRPNILLVSDQAMQKAFKRTGF